MSTAIRSHAINMHRLFSIVLVLVLILSFLPVINYPVSALAGEKGMNSRGIKGLNIYDFSSGAGVDKWAYEGLGGNDAPPADPTTGAVITDYTLIATSNDVRLANTAAGSATANPFHRFTFIIPEDPATITNIDYLWEGCGSSDVTPDNALYIWSFATSAWDSLGSNAAVTPADGTVSGSITTGFSNYINATGYLHLCVAGIANAQDYVYTDYVYIMVTSESEPLANFTLSLQSGWNLIALPVYNTSLNTAEQLTDAIPAQYVRGYNSSSQSWVMHQRNKTENNFGLENGTGYFVYLETGKDFMIEGKELPGVEINLKKGWNSIGWYENNTTYPGKIMSDIINSSSVAYWNASLSRFVVHLKGAGMSNFSIPEGMGLFVYTETDTVWDTLPTIFSVEQDATSVLGPYDSFNVTLKGDEGYTASFGIGTIVTGIPMIEENPGVYKGNYTIKTGDPSGTYTITGYLSSDRYTDNMDAPATVTIDTTPPAISNVKSGNINNTAATVNWTTDENSNSIVEYGISPGSHPNSTWNDTAVAFHQINLTGLTSGTKYYYVVKSQDMAGNQATSGEYNFTTTGQTFTILLVDDDNGGTYETNFQSALDANNYKYDYWSVKADGSPSTATLSNYDVVIWFTSDDYNTATSDGTLTATDRTNLEQWLGNGRKLFITGQDIGYDANTDSWLAWYNTNLHASYLADNSGGTTIDGISGDPVSDGFNGIGITGSYPDEISKYDSYAEDTFYYGSTTKIAGIKSDNGTSRVMYLACMYFEGSDTSANKATIMDRIIKWLNEPPDLTPPTFDGIKYVNDTVYNGTLNLTWNPASDPSTPITYNIYESTTPGGQNFATPTYTTTSTEYRVSGLTNGQTYYYVVRVEDKFGNEDNNIVEKSATPTGTETATQKYAVIVGISDYKSISDLSYCDEDATDWYNYLISIGYKSENVWVYGDTTSPYPKYDGVATEYNVKKALNDMIANATSADTLLFCSSGHGSGDGAGSSYLCMWDSSAGENGEDGNLYDTELAAIFATSPAQHNFIFLDHCYSGGMGPELLNNANGNTVYCTTTCTENGYGYDDSSHQNGAWTYWFLEWGLVNANSGHTDMEGNFQAALAEYPYSGGDTPQQFDGDTGALFYL